MKKSAILFLAVASTFLFSTCKKDAQVDLVGSWKMSSICTGDGNHALADVEVYPGDGDDQIIITNIIEQMTVYYSLVGEVPVETYSLQAPGNAQFVASIDKKDLSVDITWTDPNYDATEDVVSDDRSFTISGSGEIDQKRERMSFDLTITFPHYDPAIEHPDGPATPKPFKNTCTYTLVKLTHEDGGQ